MTETSTPKPTLRVPKLGAKGCYHRSSNPADATAVEVVDRVPRTVFVQPLRSEKIIEIPAIQDAMAALDFEQAD